MSDGRHGDEAGRRRREYRLDAGRQGMPALQVPGRHPKRREAAPTSGMLKETVLRTIHHLWFVLLVAGGLMIAWDVIAVSGGWEPLLLVTKVHPLVLAALFCTYMAGWVGWLGILSLRTTRAKADE